MTKPEPGTQRVGKRGVSFKQQLRIALADYMRSEGCSCCRNQDLHDNAKARLAKLLDVPKYSDGSGYNFGKFRSIR